LKVPKKLGEKAISLASRLNLLNKNLRVSLKNNFLYVPLLREPEASHLREFKGALQEFEVTTHTFSRCVKHPMRAIDLVRDLLPPDLLEYFPRSIDFVGDIAVVEVPSELENYKQLIGEAILRAHKNVRTVLAKASAVSGVHRLRRFDLIAGENRTETIHREHGCVYYLDLAKVYFSPRLSYEHDRVASQVAEGETVIDMFAGIGPFSILIAKRCLKVKVYAIDLNPEAVKYLRRNIIANRVEGKVMPVLGDAKEVIRSKLVHVADRVIMNLPERAIEFLESACEALKLQGGIIHFYSFEKGLSPTEAAKRRLTEALKKTGCRIERVLLTRTVREVSPYTWQVVVDVKIGF